MRLVCALGCCALTGSFGQALMPVRVFTTAYPPYAAPELPQQGAAVLMLREILEAQGFTPVVDFLPWARLEGELRAGAYDLVLLAWPGDLKRHGLLHGAAWFGSRLGLYVRRSDLVPEGLPLTRLANRPVGIVRDYAYPDLLMTSGLRLEVAASDAQNLRKLAAGRIDAVVLERAVGQHLLKQETKRPDAAAVTWQEPAISVVPLYAALVPGRPLAARLRQALDDGLQAYKRSGRYARLLRDHELDAPP
jgi:polar amino acid transport system substrate-binding protein